MVSSVESVGVVDTESGTIVWVRRRNGSWWPGRILGPQDLSASHLMSPRSGTPVKLLGREDASVDWYNLEKSKRVKAFRCGEFDDCIERAEASHRIPAKRREKYARREDAILHALELEKQFLEIKCVKSVKPKGNSTEAGRKLSITTVKSFENGNGKLDMRELCQPGSRVHKSCLMEKNGVSSLAQKAKHAISSSLEDHSIMVGSQIKELQGVGLKAVTLNTTVFSTASEDSNRTAIDGQVYGVSGSGPCLENSTDSDSRISIGKGKRLLDSHTEEAVPKRHRVVRPCVNVRRGNEEMPSHSLRPDMCALGLSGEGSRYSESTPAESSHMFSGKQGLQGQTELRFSRPDLGASSAQLGPFAETISGSSEDTESDSAETHSIDQNVEAGMLLSDAETCMRVQPGLCDRLAMQVGPKGISSDESDEASFEDKSQLNFLEHNPSDAEVSRWQLKGKRNVRNMGKRFTQRAYFDPTRGPMSLTETSHCQSDDHDNDFSNDAVFSEDDFDHHPHGYGQRGYLPFQAEAKRHNYTGPNMIDWESGLGRPLRGYWGERSDCFSPMFARRDWHDMLMDVDLQVQANRQGEHVPWVSLMSKLNGKAIIGHPVQIESLEYGSTNILLSTSDNEFRYESDGGTAPPVWKTARRTANVRPLRPHQLSEPQLDIDGNTDYHPHHQSGKRGSKKSPAPSSGRKGSLSKITNSHVSRLPQGTNKAYRKVNYLSNQKTKPLSSLGFNQVTNRTSGKPVVSGSTTVACIPVKLAFSRLFEAFGLP